ncbi:putative adenylate/guanylate cyclase [Fulvivirga imtechensis AK7]|uniref:Putative adenylate/guanylate cyclase n=1 Tax=Fulvivirga imtechensis AK7 TaxID=1237149 RepID=L8K1Y5_9BACT|nr:YHS domain-containing protein [Fulvivirga imtechensis]ELR73472.1 putative adenylate/guanylate cyclase [Fulvivirga imtechensis AK7]
MEKDIAILMADLSGYTALTDVHGGASAAKIVSQYMELVNHSLCRDCNVVQRIGDQVVITSDHPMELAVTAQNLIKGAMQQRHFLSVHAGLHYGAVYHEGGSLFGSTINVASRIMNMARHGQVLCSESFILSLPDNSPCQFNSAGKHRFKNVLNEMELFEMVNDFTLCFHMDPVCHMLVDPESEDFIWSYRNKDYFFCSPQCKELFMNNPGLFMGEARAN